MQPSSALTEFQIRKPLLRGIKLDGLPPDLQDTAADLLCTIIDAAKLDAVEALRKIASKLAPKTTRKDPHQAERPLVTQLIDSARQLADEGEEPAMAARVLLDGLRLVDPAFTTLDPSEIERELNLRRSIHKIAAALTVECGAFGETKPTSKVAREAAIARVAELSLRAQDA